AASVVGREVIHRRFAPGQAEGHHQLCPQSVGSKSPYALGEDHVVAARQQGNASPFLEGDRRRVGSRPGQGRLVGVPASGVEIDACPDDGRGSGAKPLQLAHRLPAGPHGCSGDEPQFGDDLGACFSIFCQVTVALEVEDGALGVGPEDTVDLPRVEAQVVEPALEFGNVVASQHRAPEEEQAVAESIPGLVQRPPGVGTDDAVGGQTAAGLELQHGTLGAGTELPAHVGFGAQPESDQTILDVPDGFAGVTQAIEAHGAIVRGSGVLRPGRPTMGGSCASRLSGTAAHRYSDSSWSMAALGRAPTMRFFSTPSWKTIIVGMLITS